MKFAFNNSSTRTLFVDTINVLNNLKKKYKLCIVTNGDVLEQNKKIKYTGLKKYFQGIVISSEIGYSKPEKEIFEIACNKMNVEPKNCVMIGDRYKTDIEGGINAGIKTIWVNRKEEKINYKFQIKELSEIEIMLY